MKNVIQISLLMLFINGMFSLDMYGAESSSDINSGLIACYFNLEENEQEDFQQIDKQESTQSRIGAGGFDDDEKGPSVVRNYSSYTSSFYEIFIAGNAAQGHSSFNEHQYDLELKCSIQIPKVYVLNCSWISFF